MFNLINSAWAQEAQQAAAPAMDAAAQSSGSLLMRFLPFFLIIAAFYLLLIRPQQKQEAAHDKVVKNLKKGDKVITRAGIVGVITKIEDDTYVRVEIAKDIEVKVVRATIMGLANEPLPANQNKG